MVYYTKLSKYLYYDRIPSLIKHMEESTVYPFTSKSLKKVIHSFGVNLRHIGVIATNIQNDGIKQICIEEMVVRAIKKLLDFSFSQKFFQTQKCHQKIRKYQQLYEANQNGDNSATSKPKSSLIRGKQDSFGGSTLNDLQRKESGSQPRDSRASIKNDEAQKTYVADILENILKHIDAFQPEHAILWENM